MPAAAARPAASRCVKSHRRREEGSHTRLLGRRWSPSRPGPKGKQVNRLYIEEGSAIARELYLSLPGRSRQPPRRLHRLHRRRHGHRGGGARHAGEDPHRPGRSGRRLYCPYHRPRGRRRRSAFRAPQVEACSRARADQALRRLHRQGHEPAARSIRWSSPRTASSSASTPRSTSTTTRSSATRTWPALRDLTEEDPTEVEASEVRPQLHHARRQDRLHGQRRRPRHGDHGHHQALRRRAGQLPRCRRRRHQGEGRPRPSRSSPPTRT